MSKDFRKHIENIVELSADEFEYVSGFFKYKKLKKHQFLVQEGALNVKDHWVISGLLKASYTEDNGKEHILQFAMEDWWVSDYQAYFNKTISKFNIDCLEPTEVLSITLEDREKLCLESHKMANFFRLKSNYGYVALQDRILSLLSTRAADRYNSLLLKYPSLFQRVPKAMIASYLGVSRETLSRFQKSEM